jgi:peptidoglycan/xylan/chitin deacetylase (PgdA/CDA1 family)
VPHLSLTFDDGPDAASTPALLDVLAAAGSRATFFPIAARATEHPRLIERMLAEGHAVGVHCDRHVRHSEQSSDEVRADTERALRALRDLGAEPSLWRTPWGDVAPFSEQIAAKQGLRIVGWSVDSHDWRGDAAREMFQAVLPGLHDGAVLLAHDGIGPGARREHAHDTIELVRMIASHAAEQGLRLEAMS